MTAKFNFQKIIKNEKIILSVLFVMLGLVTYFISHREEIKVVETSTAPPEIDELIPDGHVLLPVELINREALSSLVGNTAVVDLLTVNPSTMSPQLKIARRVKLIRTPKNPDYFALLVQEQDSTQILSKPGPYFALVQNKKRSQGSIYKEKQIQNVSIQYQE